VSPPGGVSEIGGGLPRRLRIWGPVGVSLALMAPSMAVNINPQGTAAEVGRAVPLAFLLAAAGVMLIAYTFVRLTQRLEHAGSVYGFVGVTLGPRPGLIAGWGLIGTYLSFALITAIAGGRFAAQLVAQAGIWPRPPAWAPYLLGVVGMGVVYVVALSSAQTGTRLLVILETATVVLILAVVGVVLYKLATHGAPGGLTLDWSVFTLPAGASVSSLFVGAVFGFLSFAGFEGGATLGEEALHPHRDIPRAIVGVTLVGSSFFVLVTAAEVMGFGTSSSGIRSLLDSGSLMGDLADRYVTGWTGTLITFGTMVSAFSCALAATVACARLCFALSRDGVGPRRLDHVSAQRGAPVRACTVVVVITTGALALAGLTGRIAPLSLFEAAGTSGTLVLLIVYGLATVGMTRLVFFSGDRTTPRWQLMAPVAGLGLLAYTVVASVDPLPTGPARWSALLALGWLALGVIGVVARPAAARGAAGRLAASAGLSKGRRDDADRTVLPSPAGGEAP